jgi:hypothetical protein
VDTTDRWANALPAESSTSADQAQETWGPGAGFGDEDFDPDTAFATDPTHNTGTSSEAALPSVYALFEFPLAVIP